MARPLASTSMHARLLSHYLASTSSACEAAAGFPAPGHLLGGGAGHGHRRMSSGTGSRPPAAQPAGSQRPPAQGSTQQPLIVPLNWKPEGGLGDSSSRDRWLYDAWMSSMLVRQTLLGSAWTADPLSKAADARLASGTWVPDAPSSVKKHEELAGQLDAKPSSVQALQEELLAIAMQVWDGYVGRDVPTDLVSPALAAVMEHTLATLQQMRRYVKSARRGEAKQKGILVSRGLWTLQALRAWGPKEAAAVPDVNSLGMDAGPLWDVACLHVSGSYQLQYAAVRDHVETLRLERRVKAALFRPQSDVAWGLGGSHLMRKTAGDWLLYRGPLPAQPLAAGRPELPWRVLCWG